MPRRRGFAWDLPAGDIRTGYISGESFQDRPVQYLAVDGLAICEGCIVLGTVEAMERRAREVETARALGLRPKAMVVNRARLRWPGGVVPFEIDPGLPDRERVDKAMAHWAGSTLIRFVPRTPANAGQLPDFVRFTPVPKGCNSPVGRQGGRQDIRLSPNCRLRQVIHEIGHAVGLYHEQSRRDRDAHVRIRFENMLPDHRINFTQQISDAADLGPYDHGSIMHYGAFDFSVNGEPTIESIPPGIRVGQATGLSARDIDAVRRLYEA